MSRKILFSSLAFLLILGSALYTNNLHHVRAAPFADGKTLVLYDAASGSIPSPSIMGFTDFPPGAASLTFLDGATVLDTTISGSDTIAGWVSSQAMSSGFPILDRTVGAQVNFTVQVENESHTNPNRAGFSVIILDKDAMGIELAFWENEIWAQSDDRTGELFQHGEGVAFATTGLSDYQVTFFGDTYTLTATSEQLLSGPVRDYRNFNGFPDPYETPNFLFLGDDTTSAQARAWLRFLSVTGMETVTPATTPMSTSTNALQPAATSTPLPGATPVPPPTQTLNGRTFEPCPSGWLFLAVVFTNGMIVKKIRRRPANRF